MSALILLLIAAGVAVLVISLRGRRTQLAGPVCGACGYTVLGLEKMICPECGVDLRCSGILTPSTPGRPRRPIGGIIVFTCVMLLVTGVSGVGLARIWPLWRSDSEQVRLITPASGAYHEVVIRADGASYLPKPGGLPIEIELTPNSVAARPTNSASLLVRPDGSYEYVASGRTRVSQPSGFGAAAVLQWMKAAGVDVSAPSASREAARITGETHRINRNTRRAFRRETSDWSSSTGSEGDGMPFAGYVSSQHTVAERPNWPPIGLMFIWFAMWACGVRYLSRRWFYAK